MKVGHICGQKLRPYPSFLCSMCRSGEGTHVIIPDQKGSLVTRTNERFYVVMENENGSTRHSPSFIAAYFEYGEDCCLTTYSADGEVTSFFAPGWTCAVRSENVTVIKAPKL